MCAVDHAGNQSRGATARETPGRESTPPSLTAFSLAGGAEFVPGRTTTATLTATDDTSVQAVCVSESAATASACRAWVPFESPLTVELSGGQGEKTVTAFVSDPYGNTSPGVSNTSPPPV